MRVRLGGGDERARGRAGGAGSEAVRHARAGAFFGSLLGRVSRRAFFCARWRACAV